MSVRNVIFDLGGVILDIDFKVTQAAFAQLGMRDVEKTFTQFNQISFFDQYDRGEIDDNQFIDNVLRLCPKEIDAKDVIMAWNSMLYDLPRSRFNLLQQISKKYRIFLLSNTNGIHFAEYQKRIKENFDIEGLDILFEKAYYSFKDGMRKPEFRYFEKVINENQLKKEETLFIDDTIHNIEAANSYGIRGHLLLPPQTLSDIFNEKGELNL